MFDDMISVIKLSLGKLVVNLLQVVNGLIP